jgi:hypothetical protein
MRANAVIGATETLNHMPLNQPLNTNANNYIAVNNGQGIVDTSKPFEKPMTTTHQYLPKIPNASIDHERFDSTHGAQHQQTTPYYADPASTPSSVEYRPNAPAYSNPAYQASPDINTTYNQNPNAYYQMHGPDMAQNPSLMEQWVRWSHANMSVYPQQTGQQTMGQEYLTPATSLVELSGRPIGMEEAAAPVAQPPQQQIHPITPVSTTAGEITRSWPLNFLDMNHNGA